MSIDEFNERLTRVRERFAGTVQGKIDDGLAVLPRLSRSDAESMEALVVTHRKLHEMCGIAPAIGFVNIGTAARAAETVVRNPAKSRRSLTASELEAFRQALEALRSAAQAELQSVNHRG